jgi:hypothetical protein
VFLVSDPDLGKIILRSDQDHLQWYLLVQAPLFCSPGLVRRSCIGVKIKVNLYREQKHKVQSMQLVFVNHLAWWYKLHGNLKFNQSALEV